MEEKIKILQEMVLKESNNTSLILMLDLLAEISDRVIKVEEENQRIRETLGIIMKGGKPVDSGRNFIG